MYNCLELNGARFQLPTEINVKNKIKIIMVVSVKKEIASPVNRNINLTLQKGSITKMTKTEKTLCFLPRYHRIGNIDLEKGKKLPI